jgi:hypothetical protein
MPPYPQSHYFKALPEEMLMITADNPNGKHASLNQVNDLQFVGCLIQKISQDLHHQNLGIF